MSLRRSDWELYKDIRLCALKSDQVAFGEPYSRPAEWSDEKWQERLNIANKEDTTCMRFAKVGKKVVGMVGWYRSEEAFVNGFAEAWGVFVRSEYRGMGIARKLFVAILQNLAKKKTIQTIKLEFNVDQETAKRLYKSLGFVAIRNRRIKLGDGLEHNVCEMEKPNNYE